MRDPRRYSGAGNFVSNGRDYAWALKLDADRLPVTPFNVISIRLALLEASAPPGSGRQLAHAIAPEFKLFSRP
jgi:hypothetical protein